MEIEVDTSHVFMRISIGIWVFGKLIDKRPVLASSLLECTFNACNIC